MATFNKNRLSVGILVAAIVLATVAIRETEADFGRLREKLMSRNRQGAHAKAKAQASVYDNGHVPAYQPAYYSGYPTPVAGGAAGGSASASASASATSKARNHHPHHDHFRAPYVPATSPVYHGGHVHAPAPAVQHHYQPPTFRFGTHYNQPAVHHRAGAHHVHPHHHHSGGAAAASAAATSAGGLGGGAAASSATASGMGGGAAASSAAARASRAGHSSVAGAAASVASTPMNAGSHVVEEENFEEHYEEPATDNTYVAQTGAYANDGQGRESSSYVRATENVEKHEDGSEDDDHYYNAHSFGKTYDENKHEAYNNADEDVLHTPNVFRSKKSSTNYVKDLSKARRETGSGVLAHDKHSASYNKNSRKFKENVDQHYNREGAGFSESQASATAQAHEDEDEERMDSDGLGTFVGVDGRVHQRHPGFMSRVGGAHGGGAAASSSAASGSNGQGVASSSVAAGRGSVASSTGVAVSH